MTATRTFIAIELDTATRAFMQMYVADLASTLPGIRFVDAATWHITLAFLGDLSETEVAAAKAVTVQAALGIVPFTLHTAGIGTFGGTQAPQVIWLGVGGDLPALDALHQRTIAALNDHGLTPDDLRFSPHITLARVHASLSPVATDTLVEHIAEPTQGPAFTVDAISVMRSDRTPSGARYTALGRVPLKG